MNEQEDSNVTIEVKVYKKTRLIITPNTKAPFWGRNKTHH